MPTGFEMDDQVIQKTIAKHLSKIATQLEILNVHLERIADTKENEYDLIYKKEYGS